MELTRWQAELIFLLENKLAIPRSEFHPGIQDFDGQGQDTPVVRYDTKEYPWITFETLIRELPSNVRVSMNQRVEIGDFHVTSVNGIPSWNFESQIVTSFLFYPGGA